MPKPEGTDGPRLLAWRDGAWIGQWPLDRSRTLRVGRSREADIVLEDELISRLHLEIRPVDGGWEVVDLGSTGGTRVGGVLVTRHRLSSGERIHLGKIGLLVLDVDAASEPAPPRPVPHASRGRVGAAVALVASVLALVAGGLLVARQRSRLPRPATAEGRRPATAPAARQNPVSQEAVRALLEPAADGVARLTPLGTVTIGAEASRFQHASVSLELPAGALAAGSQVTVSRVDAVPIAMRDSFPLAKWGKSIPIAPILQVDTPSHVLGRPATVSIPLADGTGLTAFTVLSWDPKTGVWDSVPARYDAAAGRVVAEVSHFSIIEIVAGVVIGGTIVVGWLVDGDWISSAACFVSAAGHFKVCYAKDAKSSFIPYWQAEGGERTVPQPAAELADALDKVHIAYEGAQLKVPAGKTWVYFKPYEKHAQFQGGGVANPYLYVNQNGSPALVKASAAHEYFHYVQYLYVGHALSQWWREASAVGVETVLFPDSTEWVKEYFAPSETGTKELERSLGSEEDTKYGYRVALFANFLTRKRGGLALHRHILERHSFQPILPSIAFALGGDEALKKAWLEYGRSLIGPDWGGYLTAEERRLIARELDTEGLRLEPMKGWVAGPRPVTPLSTHLYDVRFLRDRIPQNRTFSGPILVRLASDSEWRALHVIAPGIDEKNPVTLNAAAGDLTTRPVAISITAKDNAVEVRRMTSKRTPATIDIVGWLVDGESQPGGNQPEIRVTWLLPPENLRFDDAGKKLVWDAHGLAAPSAKPAAPFNGYGVYRQLKAGSEPELLDVALEPEFRIQVPDGLCARYAVTARLTEAQVRGTWESDRTEWLSVDLKDPKDFTLEGKLSPLPDSPAKMVDVTASESVLGIRGLEIEATVDGVTRTLYKKERTADQQTKGPYQPEEVVTFTLPPAGTGYRIVARAWLLPRDHRCFDKARHLQEKVIAEEKGAGTTTAGQDRTVVQDSSFFKGPRAAIEVGIGKAACIGTGPNNLGKRTELTFTEFPKADQLTLDGTIAVELKTKTEPNAPALYAFFSPMGLVVSQRNGTAFRGVKDGYLYPFNPKEPHLAADRRPSDAAEWTFGGVMNFDKAANRGGPTLTLQCQSGEPGPQTTTTVNVTWKYPVDEVFMPKGIAGPAPSLSDFPFAGRYRVEYVIGDTKAVFVENVERDASGRLKTFQPASTVTGRTEDRQQQLPRLDGVVGADGSFRYSHRMWGRKRLGEPAEEQRSESGSGRVAIVDGRTFKVEMTLTGKPVVVTYTRLP